MTIAAILHWVYAHFGESINVLLGGSLLVVGGVALQRGKTIQNQKVQIMKTTDDAQIAPLQAQAQDLEKQMETADANANELESRLDASLKSGKPGGGGSGN